MPTKLPPYHPKPLEADGQNDEDDQILLTSQQLSALDSHDEVQRKFRDDRVKTIVRRIDSEPDRAKALEKEMHDPAFLEFCEDILIAIGVKTPEDAQISLEQLLKQHCDKF